MLTPRFLAATARSVFLLAALAAGAASAAPDAAQAIATAVPARADTGVVNYDLVQELFHPVHAQHGMVTSQSAAASEIGLKVL